MDIHFLIDTQTVCIAFAKGAIGVIDGDQVYSKDVLIPNAFLITMITVKSTLTS